MANSLSIKFKECYPAEVYVSEAGYLCIKQSRDLGRDDSLILLSPERAELIADFIHTNRTEMLEAWMGGVEQEGE